MTEIAAELGLSRSTVSAVVNGKARQTGFSEKTIQRVLRYVEQRGYVPSRGACRLQSSPACAIGILQCADCFIDHLMAALYRLASEFAKSGCSTDIALAARSQLLAAVKEFAAQRVTDLVWVHDCGVMEDYRNEEIACYLSNMRTIIYNYMFDASQSGDDLLERGYTLVGVDRMAHTRRLASFLKHLGHRVVALPDIADSTSPRYAAFQNVGLTVVICPLPFSVTWLIKAMREQGVTAVCFHGDGPASLAICELRAAGIRVPEDLTVTGFGGMSKSYNTDLTTLVIPVEAMVAKVGELVKGREQASRYCFALELVEGKTHGPPRRVDVYVGGEIDEK